MSGLFCPKCGKQHTTKGQYCSFCGEDLADAILEYKDKRLPVKLNHTAPQIKEQEQEPVKKYPTGRPLPKPGRAGKDVSLMGEKERSAFDIIFWCCT